MACDGCDLSSEKITLLYSRTQDDSGREKPVGLAPRSAGRL